MNDNKYKEKLRQELKNEVPDVLSKIKASPDFYVPPKERHGISLSNLFSKKLALSILSVFVVGLFIVTYIIRNTEPVIASTVTLDINPSIIINLDDDNHVISVSALDDDGIEFLSRNFNYKGLDIDEFVELLVTKLNDSGYIIDSLDDNNIVLIEVSNDDEEKRTTIENLFKLHLENEMQRFNAPYFVMKAREILITPMQQQEILQDPLVQKISPSKLTLIYRIYTLDSEYSIEELSHKSIRELYSIFISLEDPSNLPRYHEMPGNRPRYNYTPYHSIISVLT